MGKELHNTIPVGTELIFTGNNGDFFIKGNKYKIIDCIISYTLDDESGFENHHWDERILDCFELPKKETKPVYTQEMADNGELPPVGSYFIDVDNNENNEKNGVLAIGHDLDLGRVIYKTSTTPLDYQYLSAIASECRVIDTRTDKEKLQGCINKVIDEKLNSHSLSEIARCLTNLIVTDCLSEKYKTFNNVKFTGSK